jgi:hypothetical protein
MVFVWSNLCDGEPHFTLSQVAINVTGRSGPLTQPGRLAARLGPSSRGAVRRGG